MQRICVLLAKHQLQISHIAIALIYFWRLQNEYSCIPVPSFVFMLQYITAKKNVPHSLSTIAFALWLLTFWLSNTIFGELHASWAKLMFTRSNAGVAYY